MVLASDVDIEWIMREKYLLVDPSSPELIQPASLDLRLDNRFRLFAPAPWPASLDEGITPIIDPALEQPEMTYDFEVPEGEAYLLQPQGFALAATLERVTVNAMLALKLEGKSSLGRLGLLVHATAGWIDPGFDGHITLELFNAAPWPIRLRPGMKIAQIAVMTLHTPAARPYGSAGLGSHYQHQARGPQPSQGHKNFRTWPTRIEETVEV